MLQNVQVLQKHGTNDMLITDPFLNLTCSTHMPTCALPTRLHAHACPCHRTCQC